MSRPAQNERPAALSTIARQDASASSSSSTVVYLWMSRSLSVVRLSGRFSITWTTAPAGSSNTSA